MKTTLFRIIKCNDCNMEYKISWDDENFAEPEKCAACGHEDLEIIVSGFVGF